MKQDPTDKYLIESYVSGDKSALAILVKRWHRIFCERAYWVLKDKNLSKDVAQESWIIIIKKLHYLKNPERFKSWALRIIYTKAIDALKKRTRERQDLKSIPGKENSTSAKEVEERMVLKEKLLTAIQDLPKEKQDIIRLFYVEEYSLREISAFLQIPVGTVKSRLFKAREKLKSLLKSYSDEK